MKKQEKTEYYVNLGLRIREFRLKKNPKWTSTELAEKSGLSLVTISNIENGKLGHVSVETIRMIARALDIHISALIDESPLYDFTFIAELFSAIV